MPTTEPLWASNVLSTFPLRLMNEIFPSENPMTMSSFKNATQVGYELSEFLENKVIFLFLLSDKIIVLSSETVAIRF